MADSTILPSSFSYPPSPTTTSSNPATTGGTVPAAYEGIYGTPSQSPFSGASGFRPGSPASTLSLGGSPSGLPSSFGTSGEQTPTPTADGQGQQHPLPPPADVLNPAAGLEHNDPNNLFATPQGAMQGLDAVVEDGMSASEFDPRLREYFTNYAAHHVEAIGNGMCGKDIPGNEAERALREIAAFQENNPGADAPEVREEAKRVIERMNTNIRLAGGVAQMASQCAGEMKKLVDKALSDAKSAAAG